MAYWLMKSEPGVYSIRDLARDRRTDWEGVRNYQVRNLLRDRMRAGDQAFFYHSGGADPAIVGIMEIRGRARPDPTQFDPRSPYHDARSRREDPAWLLVQVAYRRTLRRPITLAELRAHAELRNFPLLARGNRLSILPVTPEQWGFILALE